MKMTAHLPVNAVSKHESRPWRRLSPRKLWRDRRATALVEFGLISPIFLATLGASIDLGQAVLTKFHLASTLATASDYALNSASTVGTSGDGTLASTLASLAASANATNWANASVVVNNGSSASVTGGTAATSGTTSNSCYCPTGSGASVVWGSATTCGSTCAGGGVAGKFVQITVSRAYTTLIIPSPMVASTLSAASVVQVQ